MGDELGWSGLGGGSGGCVGTVGEVGSTNSCIHARVGPTGCYVSFCPCVFWFRMKPLQKEQKILLVEYRSEGTRIFS